MAVNSNLYPPLLETYSQSFLINSGDASKDTCKIYFSLSQYNSISEIANAQITVCNQNYNQSVLDSNLYPCAIMLSPVLIDNSKETDDKYYIEIKKTDIEGGFKINQYYKVQIRFTSTSADKVSYDTPQKIDS